jgi:putative ABC transport system permease protein
MPNATSLWRHLTRGLRVLTNRDAADRDAADELQHYLDESIAALVDRGYSRDDAHRLALRDLGNLTVAREQVRAYGWENVVSTTAADVRHAARRLRRTPGFTIICIVTLALGIGASTAIVSVVNPVLFERLPYPRPERIVTVWDVANGGGRLEVTFGSIREIVQRSRAFEATAALRPWQPTMTGWAEPERLEGQRVGASYFRVLGVAPAIGRDFNTAEDVVNGPKVVIISDALWRRRFSADPALVGQPIGLDDDSFTVVGIMPARFENVLAPSAELWMPLQYDTSLPANGREWGHHLRMVGRLRTGVGVAAARQELNGIADTPLDAFPRPPHAALTQGFLVGALRDDIARDVKPALVAVLGAVLLVLGIACVNVTNLLLARSAERRGELAMRAALGAGRLRLVRQQLAESLLLAIAGGALAMVVADAGVRALIAISPPGLPRLGAIGLDRTIFAFALGLTTLVGLAVGLVPALSAVRTDLKTGLHDAARGSTGGHQRTRRALVVAEIALALVVLICTGLLLRSLQRLFAVPPGFQPAHLVTMQVQTTGRRFADRRITHRYFATALENVRSVSGVIDAGFTSQLPLSGTDDMYGVHSESSQVGLPDGDGAAFRYGVTPGYAEAIGLTLRRGRLLDAHDAVAGAPGVALISESLAKSRFPNADPIGRRLQVGSDPLWHTVVGVVGDVMQTSLATSQPDAVYIPTTQWNMFTDRALWLVARVHGDTATLTPSIKRAIWSTDKDQPIVRVGTMAQLIAASAAERRFALIVFEAFALVALTLAAIGLYGVLAGSVTERTREIGVRSALGASRADILGLILRQGLALAAAGIGIGLAGASIASGGLVTLLFGVTRLDPLTHVGVVALLTAVAALASWLPAWRAARVDPAITLRAE